MGGIGAIIGGSAFYAAASGVTASGGVSVSRVNKSPQSSNKNTIADYNRRFDRFELSGNLTTGNANKGNYTNGANGTDKLPASPVSFKENKDENPQIPDDGVSKSKKTDTECQTCANREYVDGSNDSGVSFQSPTKVAPEAADSAVRAHENEHVTRNASKAEREGMTARSTVAIHTSICPECGRVFVSGGTTTTSYSPKAENSLAQKFAVGIENGGKKQEFAA
ncbi:MAG: hypothetical protein LBL80_05325 [Ruminococcus sp.]|jgi:hypothetical protein|nr:hypothetical protein [Ruminococcus sp.]